MIYHNQFNNIENILINFLFPIKKITTIKNNFFVIKKIIKNNNFIIGICYFNIQEFDFFINVKKNFIFPIPLNIKKAIKKRKAEYIASRLLVKEILLEFGYKNFLLKNNPDRSPIWPLGIKASLSHSDNIVVLVTTNQNFFIGIDIEKYMTQKISEDILNYLLISSEKKYITSIPLPLYKIVTLIFSLKESFYKAFYPMINEPINFYKIIIKKINMEKNIATIYFDKIFYLKPLKAKFFFINNKYVLTFVKLINLS